jgi:hypothetical protein
MTFLPSEPACVIGSQVESDLITSVDAGDRVQLVFEQLGIQYKFDGGFSYYGRPVPVSFFLPQLNMAVQYWTGTGNEESVLSSIEKEACFTELKFRRIGRFYKRLLCVGVVANELDPSKIQSFVVPIVKHADHISSDVAEFKHYLETLVGWTPENPSARARLVLDGKTVFVLAMVDSHASFVEAVSKIRETLTGETLPKDTPKFHHFIGSMYYLLGWIVGDIGKTFTSERLQSARLAVELSKSHSENIPLGEFVGDCVKELGVPWIRRPDKRPTATNPKGAFRWQSLHSSAFGWFHSACLGLGWTERTTRTAVKMEWLLTAPPEFRIWFLRGLADSDGAVHLTDKAVDIITQPNTQLVVALFQSLGIHARVGTNHDCGMVTISGSDAAKIKVFNPEVMTHRRKILEKLTNARTFQRHWPRWLQAKVETLLIQGLEEREICERLLDEEDVYVKYKTIRGKRNKMLKGAVGEIRSRGPRL